MFNMSHHLTTWGPRVYFPFEERCAADCFIALENPLLCPGLNPRTLGPMTSTLTSTSPRRRSVHVLPPPPPHILVPGHRPSASIRFPGSQSGCLVQEQQPLICLACLPLAPTSSATQPLCSLWTRFAPGPWSPERVENSGLREWFETVAIENTSLNFIIFNDPIYIIRKCWFAVWLVGDHLLLWDFEP
jgi:hypothetical protein